MVCTRKKDYGEPPVKKRRVKPKEFIFFSKLPCELRLEIWKHSMNDDAAVGLEGIDTVAYWWKHIRTVLPAQFSVNLESRECALRHYNLRLSISVTVGRLRSHWWPRYEKCEGFRYHANVVLSSDDNLCVFGEEWMSAQPRHVWKCQISNANTTSPWNSQSKSRPVGARPEVKQLAPLGPDLTSHARILVNPNSMVSWDLDLPILDLDRDHDMLLRKKPKPSFCGPQYVRLEEAVGQDFTGHVLVLHARFLENLEALSQTLVPALDGGPDIRPFELRWKP